MSNPVSDEVLARLSVEEVKQIASGLKREIEDINQKFTGSSNKIINVLNQSSASVDGNLINTITYGVYGFQRSYMGPVRLAADFIEQQADKFKQEDTKS
ncbi:hypothetical protein [Bacillus arachidis]|uniref:hypothetical protein n=1 Tax=Bacillus arachidis TaxID=2819290 RepID=UPI001FB7BBDF|nr:hypothetical protein [Bacillus arachidis]